jgi:hypothetical protein
VKSANSKIAPLTPTAVVAAEVAIVMIFSIAPEDADLDAVLDADVAATTAAHLPRLQLPLLLPPTTAATADVDATPDATPDADATPPSPSEEDAMMPAPVDADVDATDMLPANWNRCTSNFILQQQKRISLFVASHEHVYFDRLQFMAIVSGFILISFSEMSKSHLTNIFSQHECSFFGLRITKQHSLFIRDC